MRRDRRLSGLSSEHHQALVLARRLALAAAGGAVAADDARALGERFAREIEPHFRVEDEVLLPALRRVGALPLVETVERDHRFLRDQAAAAAAGRRDGLADFAARLTAHVRFEERELFPACETRLPSAVLDEVWRRAPKRG